MFACCNVEINTCYLSLRIGAAMLSDCCPPKFIIYITATAFQSKVTPFLNSSYKDEDNIWLLNMHTLYKMCLITISLGRPEIFEKVAKIGVGVHIWLLQVSKLTHY